MSTLATLKALVGAAQDNPAEGRLLLESTGAVVADVPEAHLRPLWSLVEARVRAQQPLDVVGIQHALNSAGASAEVRSVANQALLEPDPGVLARERLELLHDNGVRRRLVESLREVARASQGGRPVAELERMVREAGTALTGTGHRVRNCAGDALAILDHLESAWAGRGEPRILTGWEDLDEALGGQINNLYAVGARPGVGKSALVAGLVRGWLEQGLRVGCIWTEDMARDAECRIIAARAGVSVRHVRGDLLCNEYQRNSIADGLEWWSKLESHLEADDARPSASPADVVRSIREMRRRGCRVVLLDNVTCLRLDRTISRTEATEDALREMRDEAQSLQLPVWAIGHFHRTEGTGDSAARPPTLDDFKHSGSWEEYARVMLGMWRPSGQGTAALRVLKQTNGPAGDDFELDLAREAAVVTGARKRHAAPPPATSRTYSRRRMEQTDEAE